MTQVMIVVPEKEMLEAIKDYMNHMHSHAQMEKLCMLVLKAAFMFDGDVDYLKIQKFVNNQIKKLEKEGYWEDENYGA